MSVKTHKRCVNERSRRLGFSTLRSNYSHDEATEADTLRLVCKVSEYQIVNSVEVLLQAPVFEGGIRVI